MIRAFIAVLLAVGFFALNVWLLKLNQKTPAPEGCEDLSVECSSCGLTDCGVRKAAQRKEDE